MASSPLYQALPLSPGTYQKRLLRLDSQSADGPLECNLAVHDEVIEYAALSYEWECEADPKSIFVNGYEIRVSQNLYDFLGIYAGRADRGLIWIDQLCIDQGNISEKNVQVADMGSIYRRATQTFIWLGPDNTNGLAISTVRKFRHFTVEKSDEYDNRDLTDDWETELTDAERSAVASFLDATYWSRHWVAQEIHASSLPMILHGSASISYADAQRTRYHMPPDIAWSLRCTSLMKLLTHRAELACSCELPLVVTVWAAISGFASRSGCKDPRDKVFATQGILPHHLRIAVDYQQPVHTVFLLAVEAVFKHHAYEYFSFPVNGKYFSIFWGGIADLAIGMGLVPSTSEATVFTSMIQYAYENVVGTLHPLDDDAPGHCNIDTTWCMIKSVLEREVLSRAGWDALRYDSEG